MDHYDGSMRSSVTRHKHPAELPEYTLWQGWFVYYLWLGPDLVYVGKTTNLGQRITAHINSPKRFDRVTYATLSSEQDMRQLEKDEIRRRQPPYNNSGIKRADYWAARS